MTSVAGLDVAREALARMNGTAAEHKRYVAVATGPHRDSVVIVVLELPWCKPVARMALADWEEFRYASAGHRLIEAGYIMVGRSSGEPDVVAGWTVLQDGLYICSVQKLNMEDPDT